MLAALALSLGLAQGTGAAAQPNHEGKPVKASQRVHLSKPRLVNPTGQAKAKVQKSQAPLPTVSRQKLAELKAEATKHGAKNRPNMHGGNSAKMPGGNSSKMLKQPSQGSFEGLSQPCCLRPPDTTGAVGKGQFVEVVNGAGFGVFSKSDGSLLKQVSFASFFGYSAQSIFDPRVLYDKKWNRWVISAEAFPESSTVQKVFYAVSTSSDATKSFLISTFDPPENPGDFYDFPQLGLDQDAVIVTANIFDSGLNYVRTRAFGLAKADLYNGIGTGFLYFDLGTPGTTAPPVVDDNNANDFLVSAKTSDNHLSLFKATGLGRSNEDIVQLPDVPVTAYTVPPAARQPGTASLLDSSDSRFSQNSTQIGNQLLNIHTISLGGLPTPRYYQINTDTSAVTTSGIVTESATSDDFNASVAGSPVGGSATNAIGRMFFTWSSTQVNSPTHQVRVKSGGRLRTDPTDVTGGNTHSTASTFYDPTGDPVERWGDYSAVTINPSATNTCAVGNRAYVVNERQISTTSWGSRIGRLGFCS
ncbi:hypothetical protein BEK98_15520 [Streptomyces diastatochromogenes]|uniref:Uncharacterized protein n=2 Tax=Streptomyces diastatochromogenes TaxID=42236 RepID=A0A233SIS5_STRDA|nr:hypothetical protein BEK98_15520 [Streptomyces diastatochromogenes]